MGLQKTETIFLLIVIVLLGLVLRLHHLEQENISVDEAISLVHAHQENVPAVVKSVIPIEGVPPGYFIFLHYWIKMFGDAAFSVRFPSLLFGILSIVILFLLTQLIFKNNLIALLSSFFLSSSMLQVLYSQEARIYSLFSFFTLLSAYSLVRWYQKRNNFYLVVYSITIICAIYTNYLSFILIMIYTFFLLLLGKISRRQLLEYGMVNSILLLLSLPLFFLIKAQFNLINTGLSLGLIKHGLPPFLAQLGLFFYALPSFFVLSFLLLVLLFKNKLLPLIKKIEFDNTIFLFLLLIGIFLYLYATLYPISLFGIPLLKNSIIHSYFLIRQSFFLAPLLYIYLAYKVSRLKKLALLCIIFIIFINVFSFAVYYQTTTKTEWNKTMQFIADYDPKPFLLLDEGGKAHILLAQYYFPELRPADIVDLSSSQRTPLGRISVDVKLADLFAILQEQNSFWLVLSKNDNDDYKILLDSRYKLDLEKEFENIKVYHYSQ